MHHSLRGAPGPRFCKAVVIALSHLRGEEGVFHYLIGSLGGWEFVNFPCPGPHVAELPSLVLFSALASCHVMSLGISHRPVARFINNNNLVSRLDPH